MSSSMRDAVTTKDVGRFVAFGTLLVAIVLSWVSLNTQVALFGQKLDTIGDNQKGFDTRLMKVDEKYNSIDKRLAVIESVVTGAQNKGEITRTNDFISLAAPHIASITPAPQVTYSITYNAPEPTPIAPTPTTVTPTPTQSVLCIAGLCI